MLFTLRYRQAFYEKDAPGFTPEWVETFPVSRREDGPDINYILTNDVATLTWAANMAALELHPLLYRVPKIDNPTQVVFDRDPGEGANIFNCAEVGHNGNTGKTKERDTETPVCAQSGPRRFARVPSRGDSHSR